MHVPRFASEFGFQALPSLLSLAKFKLEKESDRNLETFKPYQYGAKGNERIEKYMGLYFRKPKDFESFVYVSQLLQAKSLKTAIEAQRQSKPRCMGSVYWQLNDYWPSISWSTVDYYGEQKAGFFAAKRAYAPVLVCGKQENNTCQIYCISDKLNPIQAELIGLVSNFSGKVQSSFRKPVSLKTNSSAQVFSIPLWAPSDKQTSSSSLVQGMHSKDCYISLILVSGKDTLATNTLYFVEEKELELTEPHITCDIQKEDDHFVAKMHSDVLAKDVWLSAGKEGVYSEENYFDLLPGCTKVLRLYSDQSKEELKKSLQIRSLYDSYDPGGNQ
jgi:beta-mannosidase